MNQPVRVFVGAGANLGEPARQIRQAAGELEKAPGVRLAGVSSFYRTQPVGPVAQPPFVNAVFSLECTLGPSELLALLLGIEQKAGRVRKERWGPRTLDLDVLFYGGEIIHEEDPGGGPGLEIPHPRLHERHFVLVPLVELAPEFIHPVLKKSASGLLAGLPAEGPWVEKIEQER